MRVLAAIVALGALLLSGCGFVPEDRKPIPVIAITVLSEPGVYMLDDKTYYLSSLQRELQKIADENRRPVSNTVRANVHVYHAKKVPYSSVEEVLSILSSMGLDKFDVIVRDTEPPKSNQPPQ